MPHRFLILCAALGLAAAAAQAAVPAATPTMAQMLDYPYVSELTAAEHGAAIGWVRTLRGVRNLWVAGGPGFIPRQVTHYTQDDGQELSHLLFTPDGSRLVFVRGGDHDANWPAEGNLAPDPTSAPVQQVMALWSVPLAGGEPVKLADGDAPAISARGQLAYLKDDHVWTVPPAGGKPELLFFDRGKDADLHWSPDGSRLAFVSNRGDHAFIGIFTSALAPLVYLAPSTGIDAEPRWSPDGAHVAFTRQAGDGGAPEPLLTRVPHPWSIWVASAGDGVGQVLWRSPQTLAGSYPDVEGNSNLLWLGDRIVFLAYLDDWQHLYSVPATGGAPLELTPGAFMVEHVSPSGDRRAVIYDANAGKTPGDEERRHVFRVAADRAGSTALTAGSTLEWTPVAAGDAAVAFITAGAREPPAIGLASLEGGHRRVLDAGELPADFPLAQLTVPQGVTFTAADGTRVHGQLFDAGAAPGRAPGMRAARPAVIFVHGGPPRQMLLGWHYMDFYSNAYAMNQYLALRGFVVLSVNYRLGIGYGRAFNQPEHAGFTGAAEYQDVVAGARYLQSLPGVDGRRIGIWGGSYGGYLTALALARNSDLFKVGVDFNGVHDWSRLMDEITGKPVTRYEKGDRDAALEVAFESSPVAAVGGWTSPVMLIQGDDDHNVPFQQMVDLVRRLDARQAPHEDLVLPNEIHGFLLHADWLKADQATADFLGRHLD